MRPPIRRGYAYRVADKAIIFPDERDRTPKPVRYCVVVERDESTARGGTRVLVVPCTTQRDRLGPVDVLLTRGTPERCWALVEHIQPILRDDLIDMCEEVAEDELQLVVTNLMVLLSGY